MEEDKNYISLIHGDLTRATQVQHGMPDSIGVMSIKTANRTILEASLLPTPRALWDSFWYEGELSCLFADSNVGKSILAVQIADRIARTDDVLYLDFELSEKQFQLRYTSEHGTPYIFPERLYRVSLDCNSLLEADFEEAIMGGIEQMALQTGCKIFIVDNLTYPMPVIMESVLSMRQEQRLMPLVSVPFYYEIQEQPSAHSMPLSYCKAWKLFLYV